MKSLNKSIAEYQKQLQIGDIRIAYKGLIDYLMKLRNHFNVTYPEYSVSGSIYQGYMDDSYFAFTTPELKNEKLKVAIVLNHKKMQFEIWLVGQNKKIQKRFWENVQKNKSIIHLPNGMEYKISASSTVSILNGVLIDNPDFDDLESLTKLIEENTLLIIKEIVEVYF